MVQAAGAVADGLVGHPIFTRRYVPDVVAAGVRRRGRADRPRPGRPDRRIRDHQRGRRQRRARRDAAAQIAFYVVVRTYAALVEMEGFTAEVAAIREAWKRRDQQAMIDAVSPAMLATMAVAGTPDEARDQLAGFGGLYDRLCCYVPSFGLTAAEITDRVDAVLDTFGT